MKGEQWRNHNKLVAKEIWKTKSTLQKLQQQQQNTTCILET